MQSYSRRAVLTSVAAGAVAMNASGSAAAAPRDEEVNSRPAIEHFATRTELTDTLELTHNPYRFSTVYSLHVTGLRKGDVLQSHSQFEVTNDLGYNVMLAHAMFLHPQETVLRHELEVSGQMLCDHAGENVTPGMHHGFRTLVGSGVAAWDGDAWVNVILYAASTASRPGHRIRVEQGYGGLSAIVFHLGS